MVKFLSEAEEKFLDIPTVQVQIISEILEFHG